MHLVAMPSKRKEKSLCFWCFSVPIGLYDTCLKMLNTRSLAIVFDLDETLIVANTLRSFKDKMKALRDQLTRETDPWRVVSISATLRRYADDRKMLKQYARTNCVEDNGNVFNVEMEEVVMTHLRGKLGRVVRPVIRLKERNIVLTRINPENCDTSVLVRLRPGWEVLRSYINAEERKRFEVFVCTMAERDYALEMWRLLDPQAHLISSDQILRRIIRVKSGWQKSLENVFKNSVCHPSMAMVIDDRSEVWKDMDKPRVHVVPAFSPYHDPQAEIGNNTLPVLSIARNVVCNVRGYFFREFDEEFLPRTSRVYYEDEVGNLPPPVDLSKYMISKVTRQQLYHCAKDVYVVPKSNPNTNNTPNSEGMSDVGMEQRLNQLPSFTEQSQPMANNVEFGHKTSQPPATIVSRPLIPSQEPGLLGPQASRQHVKEDNTIERADRKTRPPMLVKESNVVNYENNGVVQNHASVSNSREFQSEVVNQNLLPSHSMGMLNEIGRQCNSKVEFIRSIVRTGENFQFSMEVIFRGDKIGVGIGSTRKDAEEQAATNAIQTLSEIYEALRDAHHRRLVDNEMDKL